MKTTLPPRSAIAGRQRLAEVALSILIVLTPACSKPQPDLPPTTLDGPTMGTSYTIKIARPPAELDRKSLEAEVQAELDKIDSLMSTYRADSELSRLNRCKANEWFPVSPETAAVIEEALAIGRLTDGAFDITVGPLVNLWNFGHDRDESGESAKIPSPDEIERVKSRVDFRQVEVRTSPPAVRKLREDLAIDLSGIAKGYAVDCLAELLERHGVENYMVEVGGELRVRGTSHEARPWRIAVEAPTVGVRAIQTVVEPGDRAMATSGDYRNFFQEDGRRYSHIIDPRSGRPVAHRLVSATVLDPSCARADALATALMVLGPEKGYELALEEELPVLLIVDDDDGQVEKATPAFRKVVAE